MYLCVSYVLEAKHLERVCLQGIQFLIENDLLKNTSEDIARFLYKGEGLNKTAIGDYLGERCVWLLVQIVQPAHDLVEAIGVTGL